MTLCRHIIIIIVTQFSYGICITLTFCSCVRYTGLLDETSVPTSEVET